MTDGFYKLDEAAKMLGITKEALKKRRRAGTHEVKPNHSGKQFLYRVTQKDDVAQDVQQKTYRVLSLWDVHVPEVDAFAFKAVLDFAKEKQPDHIVLGGDFLELESCSMHGGNADPHSLLDEIKAGKKFLSRLREACPDAGMTYLEGNHETRLKRVVVSSIPTLDGALSIPELLCLDEIGCAWVPYRHLWAPAIGDVKGALHYSHGEYATMHHAKKHLDTYGVSIRYGHTHRPQTTTRGFGDGRVLYAIGSPCLRTLDPSWASPHNGWLHGFGWDEFFPDGTFTAHNVVMWDRKFAFDGKIYGR